MRVLMLGWEFPPFITGGLGTACHGLTKALDSRGIEVIFALPKAVSEEAASHVRLLSPQGFQPERATSSRSEASVESESSTQPGDPPKNPQATQPKSQAFENVTFLSVPVPAVSAYARPGEKVVETSETFNKEGSPEVNPVLAEQAVDQKIVREVLPEGSDEHLMETFDVAENGVDYGGDMFTQAQRYARFCLVASKQIDFDVIHAHDWLTYPAGLAAARWSGKPLIVHVHSTEFDRSGEHVNQRIYDIERRGMHGALRVITVSQLTKGIVVRRYGVNPNKVQVVYNGVEIEPTQPDNIGIRRGDKIVLYFGRITMQKGPEYFIRTAKRVLEYMDDVKFVVAGSGDMAQRMIEMAAAAGIGHKVLFTGFLRGKDIKRVFRLADVYVMPSVSEPFGIAPLEAMSNDVPVIISKSSGVSEVLTHALKVDFWDVEDMANKIIAVLRYPLLSRTLREHGAFEVRGLNWGGAAERCEQVYRDAVAGLVGV